MQLQILRQKDSSYQFTGGQRWLTSRFRATKNKAAAAAATAMKTGPRWHEQDARNLYIFDRTLISVWIEKGDSYCTGKRHMIAASRHMQGSWKFKIFGSRLIVRQFDWLIAFRISLVILVSKNIISGADLKKSI